MHASRLVSWFSTRLGPRRQIPAPSSTCTRRQALAMMASALFVPLFWNDADAAAADSLPVPESPQPGRLTLDDRIGHCTGCPYEVGDAESAEIRVTTRDISPNAMLTVSLQGSNDGRLWTELGQASQSSFGWTTLWVHDLQVKHVRVALTLTGTGCMWSGDTELRLR